MFKFRTAFFRAITISNCFDNQDNPIATLLLTPSCKHTATICIKTTSAFFG